MTKKSIAEAFFIYDLYQVVNSAMSLHKQKLAKFKQLDIEKFEIDVKKIREETEIETNQTVERLKSIYKNDEAVRELYTKKNKIDLRVTKRDLKKAEKEGISRINRLYKEYSKDYHTMTVLEDLVYNKAISAYMCKQYLQFMRKYIEELRFKELVIGIEV